MASTGLDLQDQWVSCVLPFRNTDVPSPQCNAAFFRSNPWMLAELQQKYFQPEVQHFCVQLCLNICHTLSSSAGNETEKFAQDYIAHKQGLACACTHACTHPRTCCDSEIRKAGPIHSIPGSRPAK